jgi:hypothetical protein
VLTGIIGWRRAWTVSMTSAVSMPCRQTDMMPRLQLLPAPGVHAELATSASLSAPHEHGATALIEIGLGEGERFLDAQHSTPQDHDQRAQPKAVRAVAGGAHDGDDLFHLR